MNDLRSWVLNGSLCDDLSVSVDACIAIGSRRARAARGSPLPLCVCSLLLNEASLLCGCGRAPSHTRLDCVLRREHC